MAYINEITRSLDSYYAEAKTLIKRYGTRSKNRILKDNQYLGNVVYAIMAADAKWKPDKGTKQSTYRIKAAIWAISGALKQMQGRKTIKITPYDNDSPTMKNLFINQKSSVDDVDYVDFLFKRLIICQRKRNILRLRYCEDKSLTEIAKMYNVSKQAISQEINLELKVLREFSEKS